MNKIKINGLREVYNTRLQEASFYKIDFRLNYEKEEFYPLILSRDDISGSILKAAIMF